MKRNEWKRFSKGYGFARGPCSPSFGRCCRCRRRTKKLRLCSKAGEESRSFFERTCRKRFHNGPTGALASECLWLHSSNLCGGVEEKAESGPANPAMCTPGEKERSIKLYVILGSYLRNRPLGLLKLEGSQDGYTVWRKLFQELEPSNRTRLRPW